MSGFLAVPRAVLTTLTSDAWFPGNPRLAWTYLVLANLANWCDAAAPLPRQKVPLKAGQLVTSIRELAKATGNSIQVTRSHLAALEFSSKINTLKSTHGTLITINGYKELFLDKEGAQHTEQHTVNTRSTHGQHYQDIETKRQGDKEETLTSLSSDETPALRLVVTKAPADHLQLAEIWNTHRGGLPAVTKVTKKRRDQMRKRWTEEPSPEYWVGAVQKLAKSSFANSSTWCSFDWLIKNDENHTKAAAGNYDDRAKDGEDSPSAREEERRRSIERLIAQGHDPFMGASK